MSSHSCLENHKHGFKLKQTKRLIQKAFSSVCFMPKKIYLKLSCALSMGAVVFLSACSSNFSQPTDLNSLNQSFSVKQDEIFIVRPDEEELARYQLMIASFSNLLANEADTAEKRAEILYQMALVYDRLEMFATARNVMLTALVEIPDLASAYNFMGVYLASEGRFSEAYDAYDAAIELNEKEGYAYFNRGIALYYGQRPKVALPDLLTFYEQDKNDPLRILWLYIVEREIFGLDQAKASLKQRTAAIKTEPKWGKELIDLYLNDKSLADVVKSIKEAKISRLEQSQRLCETYFYAAKLAMFEGNIKRAWDLFHLVSTTRAAGYIEYRFAQYELNQIEKHYKDLDFAQEAIKAQNERDLFFKEQLKAIEESEQNKAN